jgi:hypothetical protein
MELPDLYKLNEIFHNTQENESLKDGYSCFTCDSYRGIGAFCFCDTIEEWKALYPAIIFIEALLDQDYEIYDPEDLEGLKSIYLKYQDSNWNEADFNSFQNDLAGYVLSYNIEFLGKTSLLLTEDSGDPFIERLHKKFRNNPNENELDFLLFLDKYSS